MTSVISKALRQDMIADMIDRHPNVERSLTQLYRKAAEHAASRFGQPYSPEDIDRAVGRQVKRILG